MMPGGYVDTVSLFLVVDAWRYLEQAGVITPHEIDSLKDWARRFTDWLLENEPLEISIHSQRAHATEYHATAWDLQVLSLSAYVGQVMLILFF